VVANLKTIKAICSPTHLPLVGHQPTTAVTVVIAAQHAYLTLKSAITSRQGTSRMTRNTYRTTLHGNHNNQGAMEDMRTKRWNTLNHQFLFERAIFEQISFVIFFFFLLHWRIFDI
jgi:hypothetical protein